MPNQGSATPSVRNVIGDTEIFGAPPKKHDLTDAQILGHFESLGNDCEFGMIQRAVGIEPLGLLRFSSCALPSLQKALDHDFVGIGRPEDIEIVPDDRQELMVHLRNYDFRYHTFKQLGDVDVEILRAQQVNVVRFLTRKLLEDLSAAEKIFVRKGADSGTIEDVAPLVHALRRHGPNMLLLVVLHDEAHPAGSVEVVESGLMRGYIDRFGSFEAGFDFSPVWLDICRGAHRLRRDASPVGAVIAPPVREIRSNLIRGSETFVGSRWWQSPLAEARLSDAVPPLRDGCAVTEHSLREAANGAGIYGFGIPGGLSSGSVHVASVSVWLPADFQGTLVGVVFDGFSSLHIANAQTALRETWQRIWVSARIPTGTAAANPCLFIVAPAGTRLFSTCWKLEIGVQPSAYEVEEASPEQGSTRATTARTVAPDGFGTMPFASDAASLLPPQPLPDEGSDGDQHPGRVIARVRSPGFTVLPPELLNDHLIPAHERALMEPVWRRGDFGPSEVVFRLVEGAIVAGDGLAFTDALELIEMSVTGHTDEEIERARHSIIGARSGMGMPTDSGSYVLCKNSGGDYYGHWLMEMFPKAVLALEHLAADDLLFIVPATGTRLTAVITDSMQALGIGPERLLRVDAAPIRVEKLILITGLTGHGCFMSPLAVAAARRLVEGVVPGLQERLYIMRDSAGRRNFANPGAVVARAKASGYQPFDPGTADLLTQVRTFAGARRVVGVMGSALTNIVFAPPDAEIVVLAPARMPDTFFWFIAALRRLRYIEVRCQPQGVDEDELSWFYQDLIFPEALAETIFPRLPRPPMAVRDGPYAPGRVYHRAALAEMGIAGRAEAMPFVPAGTVEVPSLAFGTTDWSHRGSGETMRYGAGAAELPRPAVDAWLLHDAIVHGLCGIVTCGGVVIDETTRSVDSWLYPGAEWLDETRLRLPDGLSSERLPDAWHMLASDPDDYSRWLLDGLASFDARECRGMGRLGYATRACRPLVSEPRTAWQQQSLDLLLPRDIVPFAVTSRTMVEVERLIYVPLLGASEWWQPQPRLLNMFDSMRAAAYAALGSEPPVPWRKLFVSQAGDSASALTNEAALAALTVAVGFEYIVLDDMEIRAQARLFAEATHIIAPHDACLTNLLFCRPGAAICELQNAATLRWNFRSLAALRHLRYGCVVGTAISETQDDAWYIEPADLRIVLSDSRFIGEREVLQ